MSSSCVADIMSKDLYAVDPDLPLSELEWELSRRRISGAPVIADGKLVGMISRADIVRRIGFSHAMSQMAIDYYRQLEGAEEGLQNPDYERLSDQTLGSQLRTLHVRDAMTSHPVTISPDAPPRAAAQLMLDHGVHRIVVVVGTQPVGLVSSFDLVRLVAESPI
ncbi:MAG TPA: CBS domain-containing protein [Polyangiaceae bacterium]|nr:CBS domain-containing protein [Polyangiaceae bacterium]